MSGPRRLLVYLIVFFFLFQYIDFLYVVLFRVPYINSNGILQQQVADCDVILFSTEFVNSISYVIVRL